MGDGVLLSSLSTARHMDTWLSGLEEWTDYMRAAGRSPGTIDKRRYHLVRLAQEHLNTSPWKLRPGELAAWLGAQQWAPNTRRSYLVSIRGFYAWALAAGHVRTSPALDLPNVRIPRSRPQPVPDTIWKRAIESAESDRLRLILMVANYAGLRRSEIAALRWDQIEHRDDGRALRIAGKGGHVRIVPLAAALAAELDAEHARRLSGTVGTGYRYVRGADTFIFPGRYGGASTGDAIGRAIKRALVTYSAHKLRHRFATRVYANTRDTFALQELLGHASPETTRAYTRVPAGALRAAVDTL